MKEKKDLRVWKNENDLKKYGFKCVGCPFDNETKLWVGISPFSTESYITVYTDERGEVLGTELLDRETVDLIHDAEDEIAIVRGGKE